MRLFILPNGMLTDRERTWWLMPPFDLKIESRIIARGLIFLAARIAGRVTSDARIDGDIELSPRIDGRVVTA